MNQVNNQISNAALYEQGYQPDIKMPDDIHNVIIFI